MNSYSLVIFDQHAVHERIRLEELFRLNFDLKNDCITSEKLTEPFKLAIDLIKENEFDLFGKAMKRLGFGLSFIECDPTEISIMIHRIPSILAKKVNSNQNNHFVFANSLIQNQLKVIQILIN